MATITTLRSKISAAKSATIGKAKLLQWIDEETDIKDYLKQRAQEYFPDAKISVSFKDENTILTIDSFNWVCEPGSDDDWFVFTNKSLQASFTIPFMPE